MKKSIKILALLLVAVVLLSAVSVVFANEGVTPGQITPTYPDSEATNKVQSIAGNILGWIRNIAAIAAVVLIAVLGIKYMLGSATEKADYKKSFIPLIVGILVVLSAATIAGWIWSAVGTAD